MDRDSRLYHLLMARWSARRQHGPLFCRLVDRMTGVHHD